MKKLRNIFKRFLILSCFIFVLPSCFYQKQVIEYKPEINVHWMKKGEPAPFDGILMDKYTFYRLVKQASECKK